MKDNTEKITDTLWTENIKMPEFPTLKKDIRTDVLIIGGGLAGVLCAYYLQRAGVDYCLLEADRICRGITAKTTAKVTILQGLIYEKVLGRLGHEKAALFLKANEQALCNYKYLGKMIPCDFNEQDAYLYARKERRRLESEMQALACLGGNADIVERTNLPFPVAGAICCPNQAQLHPLKFAAGIAGNLKIYENSRVREMTEYFALTDKGSVTAEKIIIATHFPFINTRGSYYMKMYQQRSHVIALEYAPDLKGMYLAAEKEGFSFRNYENYLLIGEKGKRTGKKNEYWKPLRTLAEEYFPSAREVCAWANQDCMTLDGMPYIGAYSKNTPDLFVATGFNKWGLTGAMLSAMVLSELVREKESPYAQIFSPSRNMLKPQLFINLGEAAKGICTPGRNHRCAHMGCTLKWNPKEQAWECPCHGSRFDMKGECLENPAAHGLKTKH